MAKLNLSKRISCVRSIAFAAGKIYLLIGGKSNSGVCRDVSGKPNTNKLGQENN